MNVQMKVTVETPERVHSNDFPPLEDIEIDIPKLFPTASPLKSWSTISHKCGESFQR